MSSSSRVYFLKPKKKKKKKKTFFAYAFEKQTGVSIKSQGSGDWHAGDSYGIEVSPPQSLPKGFKFSGSLSHESAVLAVQYVTFEPDGTVRNPTSISIEASAAAGGKKLRYSVSQEGKIDFNES